MSRATTPWPDADVPSWVARRLGNDCAAHCRVSVTGEPRAPLCGMGVCQECVVDVEGLRRLACQTLCSEPGSPPTPMATAPQVAHCDLLIIGAGPAGLAAAEAAARSGLFITIVDDNARPGGQIWRDGPAARLPTAALRQREVLAGLPNVRWCLGHNVVARGPGRSLVLEGEHSATVQHFSKLVLATGARELLLPFPGWTLPGVTGAGGLQALIKGGLPVDGQRVVIAGTGPLLLAVAKTARQAGAQVLCVAEQAPWTRLAGFAGSLWRWPGKALQAAMLVPPRYRSGSHVQEAVGTTKVEGVHLKVRGRMQELACDRVACGFGLVPNTELAQLLGCQLDVSGAVAVDAWQRTSVADVWVAGECGGIGGVDAARAQGALAGLAAASDEPMASSAHRRLQGQVQSWRGFSHRLQRHFALSQEVRRLARPDTLVCRCEDVSQARLADCDSWLDAKLHTRCGMGPCQGRVCGAATQAIFGWQPAPPRQPLWPTRIATLAALEDPS